MSLQRDLAIERKNLTQLEGKDWGHSSSESYIERGCHELRYKPLADMDVEDLRLLIGQNIGLRYLMPIAFDVLRQNPLTEGMHYPGDLLSAALRTEPGFYDENPAAAVEIQAIAQRAIAELGKVDERLRRNPLEGINEALTQFRSGRGR
nr:contact-dependent growth inhibition system immunity protein [Dyella sp. ASV24]